MDSAIDFPPKLPSLSIQNSKYEENMALRQPPDIDPVKLEELTRRSQKQLKLDSFAFEDDDCDDDDAPIAESKSSGTTFTTLAYQNSRFAENEALRNPPEITEENKRLSYKSQKLLSAKCDDSDV